VLLRFPQKLLVNVKEAVKASIARTVNSQAES
jgi:hypothetical protein